MKKLNLRRLKERGSMLIWKNKKKNFLGLSLAIDMNIIKSTEDLDEFLTGAVKTLKLFAKRELAIFRTETNQGRKNQEKS